MHITLLHRGNYYLAFVISISFPTIGNVDGGGGESDKLPKILRFNISLSVTFQDIDGSFKNSKSLTLKF